MAASVLRYDPEYLAIVSAGDRGEGPAPFKDVWELGPAEHLAAADVEVEFHLWPGLPHGFESAPGIGWVKKALEARNDALRRA
ncbi:hypothetical protein Cob_v009759 [Colletotrichum orbiculare MAFF 240422]|uniref:Uncharacterized protein n=1 Tax=Colletotrichum orbiculare (strain 104-T / ATCC 96160 / CBS 514.97 / LARS 414 / MAFF 240422) TaxID=1213857 RepID=A0A484FHX5_COLOR|nr:hypothetical protein Cob_v009759 [Colletotrichum orbiculare MAFF 240422]